MSLLFAGLCLAMPSIASAADPVAELTASTQGGKTLSFTTAAGGRANSVRVQLFGANYRLTDTGTASARVTAGTGCSATAQNQVTCPATDVDSITLELGTGNDSSLIGCQGNQEWICSAGESPITVPALIDGGSSADPGGPLPSSGSGCNTAIGNGLFGGQGPDMIIGGAGVDILVGGSGSDRLQGGIGADLFCGGALIVGSTDRAIDFVDYSDRTDPVSVNLDDSDSTASDGEPTEHEQVLTGNTNRDQINGIIGGGGADRLIGDSRNNTVIGGLGADDIRGGHGVDVVSYADRTQPLQVTIGDKDAATYLSPYLAGNDGAAGEQDNVESDVEDVIGGEGNDTLVGADQRVGPPISPNSPNTIKPGRNMLLGMGGNDTLDGRLEADVLSGGDGFDRVVYGGTDNGPRTQGVAASLGTGEASGAPGEGDSILTDVEALTGSALGDSLAGAAADDTIDGAAGDDTIVGGGGSDNLVGGLGVDTIGGEAGGDAIDGGEGNDAINGGDGNDFLSGAGGDDSLIGGDGADNFGGGTGTDRADYAARLAGISATVDGVANDGNSGEGDNIGTDIESLTGGSGADALVGGAGGGTIDGGAGNDMLDGGPGSDTLAGGPGNDEASYSQRTEPVSVTVGSGADDGQAGESDDVQGDVERLTGGAGSDSLVGDGGANVINGLGGNDSVDGRAGQDAVNGGDGNDTLSGGDDADTIAGDQGSDRLLGDGGNDFLRGWAGDDNLDGGSGSDTLDGGSGADTADYVSRSADLALSIDGASNDGVSGEGDNIKTDVENLAAGSGNDTVNSADGITGHVSCGAGNDSLTADPSDTSSACEAVIVQILGARPVGIAGGKVKMSKKGTIKLRLSCPRDAKLACKGSLSVTADSAKLAAKRRAKATKIGAASVTVDVGKTKLASVRLTKAGRKAVKRAGKKGLSAKVSVAGTFDSSATVRIAASKSGKKKGR